MSETVRVGCTLPNGIILRISDWVKDPDGNPFLREVASHEIGGVRHDTVQPSFGALHDKGDATFTEIPAGDFDKWLEQNEHSDLVKSGAVFKATDEDVKAAEDKEKAKDGDDEKPAEDPKPVPEPEPEPVREAPPPPPPAYEPAPAPAPAAAPAAPVAPVEPAKAG